MPHEFTEWEQELRRSRRLLVADFLPGRSRVSGLDPPVPPKRQLPPNPPIPRSKIIFIFAIVILMELLASALLLVLR